MLLNQVMVCGRLGKDPEMSYSANGIAFTRFTMAVDRGLVKGEKISPMWLKITCFGKLAERSNERLSKGEEILVQGKLDIDEYTDKEGIKRLSVGIIASMCQPVQYKKLDSTDTASIDETASF